MRLAPIIESKHLSPVRELPRNRGLRSRGSGYSLLVTSPRTVDGRHMVVASIRPNWLIEPSARVHAARHAADRSGSSSILTTRHPQLKWKSMQWTAPGFRVLALPDQNLGWIPACYDVSRELAHANEAELLDQIAGWIDTTWRQLVDALATPDVAHAASVANRGRPLTGIAGTAQGTVRPP